MKLQSNILKLALFATGLAGIVAEYILGTLAAYFLGNEIFQMAFIVSTMMFAMGIGSRLSKRIEGQLLEKFIFLEVLLSLVVSFSSIAVYTLAGYSSSIGVIIYGMGMLVGLLIGMEIPLVVRINESNEGLRYNISSALENDYYGSLVGGLFFVFIGLPKIGLIHTPYLLGCVNLLVAILLFVVYGSNRKKNSLIYILFAITIIIIGIGVAIAKPIILHGEQIRYKDKVIYSKQSAFQKIVITEWKGNYWLYLNRNQQLSTLDEAMYHEPLVHPAMQLHPNAQNILVLGGGDGCATRELLKYESIRTITVIDLDSAVTNLAKTHPVLTDLNDGSFFNPKVNLLNEDAFTWLENSKQFFDLIIIDLPDPKTVTLSRLYSTEFYTMCKNHLRPQGILVTQAGSPYFATRAFLCINKTMENAGFRTVKYHNQIITMGEWGWVLGVKGLRDSVDLKQLLMENNYGNVETRWLNQEANHIMFNFGKNFYVNADTSNVEVNKIHDPVLQQYYLGGNWDIY